METMKSYQNWSCKMLEEAEGNQEQHQALRFHVTVTETAGYV